MVVDANIDSHLQASDNAPSSFYLLLNWIIEHTWYVHSASHIQTVLSPSQTYKILETAAKPSVNRLGLRKLFARGRRYFIRAKADGGFQMTTTNKVWWHPKHRNQPTSILSADFEPIDETSHRLKLKSRVKLRYLIGQFFWPTFISSIIIFLAWSPIFLIASIVGLYGLSWIAHRLTARLEAYEITYFIETVLNDFAPESPQQLSESQADVIVDDFTTEWDRYVEEKQQ